jgi:hypothetical protein
MGNHYEDCPWREQALYVVDSINQMLCGYYAFEETEFQRESLLLIPKSVREDGLLEIVSPSVNTPAIPFFSVMYPVAICEYVEHTKDLSLLDEVFDSALEIMNVFKSRIEDNGLIARFLDPYWNFYEWSDGAEGQLNVPETEIGYDLILNCAFLYSYERFKKLCAIKNVEFDVDVEKMKKAIKEKFYDIDKGMNFLADRNGKQFSQLGNAFALLVGLDGEKVINAIKGEGVIPATLSMMGYVYDALLSKGDYKDFVLNDIRKNYKYMLDNGATSFWETILGDVDFDNAGSLCHGWSAIPAWFASAVRLGVKPLDLGFAKFSVKPWCGDYQKLSGEIPTPSGMIDISWEKVEGGIAVKVKAPKNLEAVKDEWPECPIVSFDVEYF